VECHVGRSQVGDFAAGSGKKVVSAGTISR
jgi:hypothetical protein